MVWVVTLDTGSYGLPEAAQLKFGALGLFAGDPHFSQPECVGLTGFPQMYALNVSGTDSVAAAEGGSAAP